MLAVDIRCMENGLPSGVPATLTPRERKRQIRAIAVAIGASGFFSAWLALHVGGARSVETFDDVVTALAAFAAAVLCGASARRGEDGLDRRFWWLLSAACGAWTFAEVVWAVYDLVLNVSVPVPSWADLGYLSAIPLAVAALLSHPALRRRHNHSPRRLAVNLLDGLLVASSFVFLSWSLVLGPLWHRTDLSKLGGIVAVAYPVGDLVMATLAVVVIRAAGGGRRFDLWCVLAGIVAMALADTTYTYLSEVGRYQVGNAVDVGWVLGYLLLAAGGYCASLHHRTDLLWRPPSSAATSLTFVPILCALVVAGIEALFDRQLTWTDWIMAVVVVGVTLTRQGLSLFDESLRNDHWEDRDDRVGEQAVGR